MESLSEDIIRTGNSTGASWWAGYDNIDFSSFTINVFNQSNQDFIIAIHVDAARSEFENVLDNNLDKQPLASDEDLISALKNALNTDENVRVDKINMMTDNDFSGFFTIESDKEQYGMFYGDKGVSSEGVSQWNIQKVNFTKE